MNINWKKLEEMAAAEIEATIAELPGPLRERAEKLALTFEKYPGDDLEEGIAPDTLGFFTGGEFSDEEMVPIPPQIMMFTGNLWEFSEGDEEIYGEEVRKTFLHELGHFFGLSEDDLDKRGLS